MSRMDSGKDWDKEQLSGVLMNTVILLCKNGITFKRNIRVQGLLGITIDDDDIFLVQINENVENESSIALSDTVVVNPVKHASCTTSSTNNSFIDKTLQQVDGEQMVGSVTKVNASSSSEEEEYRCVEYMQSCEDERQHHVLCHCTTMKELKQEKDEVKSDFEALNVYNTSDAGVSGECINPVNIKCEMEEDFCYSTDQLTDDNSLVDIKQEPQSDNIVCLPHPSSTISQGSLLWNSTQGTPSFPRVNDKQRHRTEREFPCGECGCTFSNMGTLKQHFNSVHGGVRPYKCTECKKSFTEKQHLTAHTVVHKRHKTYTCTECGKSFSDKSNLKRHMNALHTKEKCYTCTLCGKKFFYRSNLGTHIKTQH